MCCWLTWIWKIVVFYIWFFFQYIHTCTLRQIIYCLSFDKEHTFHTHECDQNSIYKLPIYKYIHTWLRMNNTANSYSIRRACCVFTFFYQKNPSIEKICGRFFLENYTLANNCNFNQIDSSQYSKKRKKYSHNAFWIFCSPQVPSGPLQKNSKYINFRHSNSSIFGWLHQLIKALCAGALGE